MSTALLEVVRDYLDREGDTGGLERPSLIRDARSGAVLRI